MVITAFYAGLLTVIYLVLTLRVVGARQAARMSLGDGNDGVLIRRIRAHGNFAEYVPLGLILLGLCESLKTPSILLYGVATLFVVSRVSHAYGISQVNENFRFRIAGMMGTMISLGLMALLCWWGAL